MKKIAAIAAFLVLASTLFSLVSPVTPTASALLTADCEKSLLGMPPWYRGLTRIERDASGSDVCGVIGPGSDLAGYIWKIALNVIEAGLVIVGYIAFFFIVYGGYQFLTGGANPSMIEKARKTILNAVIGLAIALGSIGLINLVFGVLG